MQKVKTTLLSVLRDAVHLIGKSPFWLVALLDLGLRLFVVKPLGALLAIAVGCVWISRNIEVIRLTLMKLRHRYTTWANAYEKKCPWFERQGRAEIVELIDWLSAQGVSYCNLADEMELPDKSQWYAISKGINELGILTQVTNDAFYVTWHLPRKKQNKPDAA